MKRITIVIAAVCLVFLVAAGGFALDFGFGVKGGVNLANFIGDDTIGEMNMKFGICAGAFGTISIIDMLALQPEVLFSQKGFKIDVGATTVKENLTYIDIPVLLKFYVPLDLGKVKLNAFAGPYFGFLVAAKEKVDDTKVDVKDLFNSVDFGLALGAGVDIGKIVIDGRYSFGFSELVDNVKWKNSVISIMGGYRFK